MGLQEQVQILTGNSPAVAAKVTWDLGILGSKSTSLNHVTIAMEHEIDKTDLITGSQLATLTDNQPTYDKAIKQCLHKDLTSPEISSHQGTT